MRRFSGFLVGMLLLVVLSTTPALADSFYIYEEFGGTWHDANKTAANTEDDLMCWAATASNILAWGNWGTPTYNTADLIFGHIQDHWTDNYGFTRWALKWWFDGSPPPYDIYSHIDVPGGGNFYPELNHADYYTSYSPTSNYLATIDTLMHQGYVVGLTLSRGGGVNHVVTCWGFEYLDPGVYTSLYLTDSDDGVLGLRTYPVTWENNVWYLGGGYSGWQIVGFQAQHYQHTPIPPSLLLFGTGVVALFMLGRRRRPENQDSTTL